LEDYLGTDRFLYLYMACGIVAGLGWLMISGAGPAVCIGASGAVFGIAAAYAALNPNRVLTLLDAFGISGLENRRLKNLSLGQYQRVALARAIAHDPELIFVDEPTASLNRETARAALQELKVLTEGHSTVMMITHEEDLAREFCDLIIELEPVSGHPAGRVKSFFRNPAPRRIDDGRH